MNKSEWAFTVFVLLCLTMGADAVFNDGAIAGSVLGHLADAVTVLFNRAGLPVR